MSRFGKCCCFPMTMAVALLPSVACAANTPSGSDYGTDNGISLQKLIEAGLPKQASEGLYVSAWAWGSYLNVSPAEQRSNGDGQLSLNVTKSFEAGWR